MQPYKQPEMCSVVSNSAEKECTSPGAKDGPGIGKGTTSPHVPGPVPPDVNLSTGDAKRGGRK